MTSLNSRTCPLRSWLRLRNTHPGSPSILTKRQNSAAARGRWDRAVVRVPAAVVSVVRGVLGMETTQTRRARLQAAAAQFVLGIAGLALITFVCFRLGFGLARTAFAYVILAALVSLLGSFSASVVLSILAAAC